MYSESHIIHLKGAMNCARTELSFLVPTLFICRPLCTRPSLKRPDDGYYDQHGHKHCHG